MRIFGAITDFERASFRTKFAKYWYLNPEGTTWWALSDLLNTFKNHIEFRNSFGHARMVYMLREMCVEAGLTREDRGESPHVLEGYYGFEQV
jgi:hypothetical protein